MWNYPYNPYYSFYPATKTGLLQKFIQGFSFQKFLDGTQKTLGLIDQAIPVYNQMKPILNNAKTMFRIVDELKAEPVSIRTETKSMQESQKTTRAIQNNPIFFTD